MKLLLDSHALIWLLLEPEQLSPRAAKAIGSIEADLFVSTASVWEIALKNAKGKLALPADWLDQSAAHGLRELPITAETAVASVQLPWHHADPFDRVIVAHALAQDLTLVTRDTVLARYGVKLIVA